MRAHLCYWELKLCSWVWLIHWILPLRWAPIWRLFSFRGSNKNLYGTFRKIGSTIQMEAIRMVFRGWMRTRRPGPQYKANENIYLMVNETTRNAYIRFAWGFTWNRPHVGRGEPADSSPVLRMHTAQAWACWSSFHRGYREWKLLIPNPAWKLRVITPFLPGPRKYHQVVQCLYVMILLMTQAGKTVRDENVANVFGVSGDLRGRE